jgi:uncharacterized membrane protein
VTETERGERIDLDKLGVLAKGLLKKPWDKTTELERRVLDAVQSRLHVSRPLHREMEEGLTLGDRMADRIAAFGGSWSFIAIFFALLAGWMILNALFLAGRAFDPYPFILLNLILSCLAAVQAPVILMSQNRQGEKDRLRSIHDYEVNLKAELEILQLHEKIDRLIEKLESRTSP